MDSNEQQMIRGLFGRLGEAERSAPPRDPEAEQFIRRAVESQPAAPYYMAQTMIVQEEALKAANARIEQLEAQVRERPSGSPGGFLGGLFGGGSSSREPARPPQGGIDQQPGYAQGGGYGQPPRGGPWGGAQQAAPYGGAPGGYGAPMGGDMMGGRGGGGFLAGAAQTAVGVAGGVMLGSMLGNLFTGGHPFGGEQVTENITNETVNETVNNEGAEPAVDSGGDYDRAAYEDGGVQDASYDDYDAGGGDFEEI
ncbi:DUF2076 domain-containing protein [Aureimonas sp. AU4]|uniref:DUF2076 domain-containing protein n=1 Tax=Aureimonas sp. AU4 TaxID=1638163 RepID=UPI000782BF96|nr:DUF2076 domain-containing protein [Aureimonas sp. AU4]